MKKQGMQVEIDKAFEMIEEYQRLLKMKDHMTTDQMTSQKRKFNL